MFDIDRFAADCRAALAERGSEAIRNVVRRAVSDPTALIAALGEHNGPHAAVLVRAPDVDAAGAASLRQGDVTALGRDIIHSVTNPLDKVSYAIHVYDGDLLSAEGKSCWHAETLCEMPCDAGAVSPAFGHALASR